MKATFQPPPASLAPASLAPASLALLHIDENENEKLLVSEAIRRTRCRFTVHTANTIERATRHFQPRPKHDAPNPYPRPALVLLDYDLGLHTGADFIFWLRFQQKNSSTPIIMYSGFISQTKVSECYAAGATHCISKPDTLAGVERIVRALYIFSAIYPAPVKLLLQLPEYRFAPS